MNAETMIDDFKNKIKLEVTPELLAELSGSTTPPQERGFVDWHAKIDEIDLTNGPSWMDGELNAQLRELLHRVLDLTHTIGDETMRIGKRIINWIFSLKERYPKTFWAVVVLAVLSFLVSGIPLLNLLLLPILTLVAKGLICYVAVSEVIRSINLNTNH